MLNNSNELYGSGYQEWKKWGRLFAYSDLQRRYFEGEFSGIDFAGKRLLEIGFGDGSFLRWAKDRGAQVVGCELTRLSYLEATRDFSARLRVAAEHFSEAGSTLALPH